MGLSRFGVFEQGDFSGITYLDRYFIKQTVVTEETIHFHELIHVIRWRLLGPEDFLAAYASGLDEFGYENSPLPNARRGKRASTTTTNQFAKAIFNVVRGSQHIRNFEHKRADGAGFVRRLCNDNPSCLRWAQSFGWHP
jgi:hypothetical protein